MRCCRTSSNQFSGVDRQRRQLDLVHKLNDMHAQALQKDAQLEARIEAFEMAFKMQTEATDAFDISKESAGNARSSTATSDMGAKLLVARRLVERGVRFVQVQHGGWDTHANIETNIPKKAGEIDGPAAALIKDLKQRGLLDSTLIIWGGEFGRTVVRDRNGNATPGRDHNGRAMVTWMAGGGVKGGTVYGATDEFGARSAENKVHIHDLHATILALLGFDHTQAHLPLQRPRFPLHRQLWQRRQGRHRLTLPKRHAAPFRFPLPSCAALGAPGVRRRHRRAHEGAGRVFRKQDPPDLRGKLLQVPQRRARQVQGRPDAGHQGRPAQGRRQWRDRRAR